jgi:hypothetical protein
VPGRQGRRWPAQVTLPPPPRRAHLRRAGRERPADAACPISTGSGTRRVHLVRGGGGNGPLRGHSPGESRTRDFSRGPLRGGPRTRERRLCGTAAHGAASERRRSAFKSSCGGARRGGQTAVKWCQTEPRGPGRSRGGPGSQPSGGWWCQEEAAAARTAPLAQPPGRRLSARRSIEQMRRSWSETVCCACPISTG